MASKIREKQQKLSEAVIKEENIRVKLVNLNKQKQLTILNFKMKPNILTSEEYKTKLEAIQLQINQAKSDYRKARIDVSKSRCGLTRAKRGPKENM